MPREHKQRKSVASGKLLSIMFQNFEFLKKCIFSRENIFSQKHGFPDSKSICMSSVYMLSVFSCSSHILGLVRGPGLAHQSDLSSKATGSSVLQKTRHCVVVEVVNEVPDPCLVSRSQLVCSQRGQRGTCSPRPTAIAITGGAQGQLRLERGEGEI